MLLENHSVSVYLLDYNSTIDMLDWNGLIDERTKISDLLMVPNLEVRATLMS